MVPIPAAAADDLDLLLATPRYEVLKKRLLMNGKPAITENNGKWACLVSRRQFKDEEGLRKHVLHSALFKESAAQHRSKLGLL